MGRSGNRRGCRVNPWAVAERGTRAKRACAAAARSAARESIKNVNNSPSLRDPTDERKTLGTSRGDSTRAVEPPGRLALDERQQLPAPWTSPDERKTLGTSMGDSTRAVEPPGRSGLDERRQLPAPGTSPDERKTFGTSRGDSTRAVEPPGRSGLDERRQLPVPGTSPDARNTFAAPLRASIPETTRTARIRQTSPTPRRRGRPLKRVGGELVSPLHELTSWPGRGPASGVPA